MGPGTKSHKPWRVGETDIEPPAKDMVVMDTAKMTGQEEEMMFLINQGTLQGGDRDGLLWQKRSACNWDIGIWSGLQTPADHLTKIRDLYSRADTKVSRGVMIPEPETNEISRYQHRQEKLPPELGLTGTDGSSLGHKKQVLSGTKESQPRMAVMVAVLTANKDCMGEMEKYNGLLVYHVGDVATSPTDRPIVGWIIADTPRGVWIW